MIRKRRRRGHLAPMDTGMVRAEPESDSDRSGAAKIASTSAISPSKTSYSTRPPFTASSTPSSPVRSTTSPSFKILDYTANVAPCRLEDGHSHICRLFQIHSPHQSETTLLPYAASKSAAHWYTSTTARPAAASPATASSTTTPNHWGENFAGSEEVLSKRTYVQIGELKKRIKM